MKWQASFKIFSLVFGVVYYLCFIFNVALFRYYPEGNGFHFTSQSDSAGLAILWYGWLGTAAAVSIVVALLVPFRWADRLWHQLSWIVPAIVLVVMFIYERRWFL
jgi:hypothetical protein